MKSSRILSLLSAGLVTAVLISGVATPQNPTDSSSTPAKPGAAADDKTIRPFHFSASKEALADLRKRIAATKWPSRELVTDGSQGVQLATIQKTNTTISSARLYWESKLAFFAPKGIAIPVAVSAFPDELYQAPRSWTEQAYPKLIHYNRLPKGGHFAAWEQPELLVGEMRAGFKSLR